MYTKEYSIALLKRAEISVNCYNTVTAKINGNIGKGWSKDRALINLYLKLNNISAPHINAKKSIWQCWENIIEEAKELINNL